MTSGAANLPLKNSNPPQIQLSPAAVPTLQTPTGSTSTASLSEVPEAHDVVIPVTASSDMVRPVVGMAVWALLLAVLFFPTLVSLGKLALSSDLHSHILLVPFISAYLLHLRREHFPTAGRSAWGWATLLLGVGGTAWLLTVGIGAKLTGVPLPTPDTILAWRVLAFLCFLAAGGFFFLGWKWLASSAFPLAFLCWMIPFPSHVLLWLENALKVASAEMAGLFFNLSATPNLRDGLFFQLPNIAIEVAPECSGIRSSMVLFITGLLAAYLFLQTPWRRALLVALIIPLGIIRNGFRIWVIGELCVYVGPHMIHSNIHKRGGPVFFVLSLLPMFLLIWWLRRQEARKNKHR